ncbi:membrane protein insertion efficiency factor YidD [Natronospora cellulosivora (SeqCode)]
MRKILILLVITYQKLISPLKGKTCRFYPTCSQYTIQAIEKYGVIKGLYLSIKRIVKCNPYHPGGYDPIE